MSHRKKHGDAHGHHIHAGTPDTLPERLILLRRKRKLKQADVAKALHISRQCYGHFEQGCRTMSPDLIIALANLYRISTDTLLRGTTGSRMLSYDGALPAETKKSPINTGQSECGQRDSNPHGLPLEPKSSASANSAMSAKAQSNARPSAYALVYTKNGKKTAPRERCK